MINSDNPATRGSESPAESSSSCRICSLSLKPLFGICSNSLIAALTPSTVFRKGHGVALIWAGLQPIVLRWLLRVRGERCGQPPPPAPHPQRLFAHLLHRQGLWYLAIKAIEDLDGPLDFQQLMREDKFGFISQYFGTLKTYYRMLMGHVTRRLSAIFISDTYENSFESQNCLSINIASPFHQQHQTPLCGELGFFF
jgi:hypothetical protein